MCSNISPIDCARNRERRRKNYYIDGNMKSINYIITFTCTQIKEIKSMKAKLLQDGYHEQATKKAGM